MSANKIKSVQVGSDFYDIAVSKDNVDGLSSALDNKIDKTTTSVQCIAGGLVVGKDSTAGLSGTGQGRIMFTGQTNPLIGVQAISSSGETKTPYYMQTIASDDSLCIGPTSSKALKFDKDGNMQSPANLTISGSITEGTQALSDKYAAKTHTQTSNTINTMEGYSKAESASAIISTDSLNTAIGKLEKALDGKQASGTYLTSNDIIQDGIVGSAVNRYCVCDSASDNAVKSCTVRATPQFSAGTRIYVNFINPNTANGPTLRLNTVEPAPIKHRGTVITNNIEKYLLDGVIELVYDGEYWNIVGNYLDTDTDTNTDKKTASANSTSTLYLIGATVQSSDGQTTYSNSKVFATNGQLTAESFYATSDKRLKENIKEFIPQKSILDLPIVEFDFKDSGSHQIGCLAQDLQEICPEIVNTDDQGYLSINENKLVYLLLDEVKKLKQEIAELKKIN